MVKKSKMRELRLQSRESFKNWLFTYVKVSCFSAFLNIYLENTLFIWTHTQRHLWTFEAVHILMLIHFHITEIVFNTIELFTIHWIKTTEKTFTCFLQIRCLSFKKVVKNLFSNVIMKYSFWWQSFLILYNDCFLTLTMKMFYTSFWTS